jgi:hypothetical protein
MILRWRKAACVYHEVSQLAPASAALSESLATCGGYQGRKVSAIPDLRIAACGQRWVLHLIGNSVDRAQLLRIR